jgi:hypothetical protein
MKGLSGQVMCNAEKHLPIKENWVTIFEKPAHFLLPRVLRKPIKHRQQDPSSFVGFRPKEFDRINAAPLPLCHSLSLSVREYPVPEGVARDQFAPSAHCVCGLWGTKQGSPAPSVATVFQKETVSHTNPNA